MTEAPYFNLKNGAELAKKFLNRTFLTNAGRVNLDEYGGRRPFMSNCLFYQYIQGTTNFKFTNKAELEVSYR
jgi:hypothetical protein